MIKKKLKRYILLIFIIFLSFPAIENLFRPGFFVSDDGEWMIIRFSAFHQELVNGQFPVRWLNRLNHSYGYPVATFLYPGFMYLAEVPKFLGFGFVDSIKIIFIVSVLSAAVFSFLWLERTFGKKAAFLGSVVYIYSPYFLWDIYKRGSLGEALAFAIVPFILWVSKKRIFFLTAAGYGLLILAHNTLSFLFIPFLVLYQCIESLKQKKINFGKAVLNSLLPFFAAMGLSAFFWIPAIFELKYTVFSQTVVSHWQEYFLGIEDLPRLGWMNLVIGLGSTFFFIRKKRNRSLVNFLILAFFLLGIFLTFPVSSFLWTNLPLGRFVQFPFRFLSWQILTSAYLVAFFIGQFKKEWQNLAVILLAGTAILIGLPFTKPSAFTQKDDAYYATNEATTNVQDEYMPKWVKIRPTQRALQRIERIDQEIIQINTIYWPGWQLFVNGQKKEISYNNEHGVMRIEAKPEEGEVSAAFKETPFRLLADFISFVSLLFLFFYVKKLKV